MNTISRRNFLKGTALLTGGLAAFGLGLSPHSLLASISRSDLPYYKSGAPFTNNLIKGTGEHFTLQGKVFQQDARTTLANTLVEIWHCNSQGQFDFSQQFSYRGKTLTDGQGNYSFKTHFPGKYQENGFNKMSRIFVLVRSNGYAESFSQLYFDFNRNPYIDSKHWESSPMAEMPTLPRLLKVESDNLVVYNHYLKLSSLLSPLTA